MKFTSKLYWYFSQFIFLTLPSALIRFIGVPTISQRLTHPGEHQSKEEVPSKHLLNQTLKDLLIKFYDPFNQLLQQFIEGT
jgi:hypothetical protein